MEQCWVGLALMVFWAIVIVGAFLGCSAKGAEVKLTWNPNPEPDIAGYVLHYGTEGLSTRQPTGNVSTYTLTSLEPETSYQFAVQAVNTAGLTSDLSATITHVTSADGYRLPRGKWVMLPSSEEAPGYVATHAKDGNPSTFWHSAFTTHANPPHEMIIDMAEMSPVSGLVYLPRQDAYTVGNATRFEVHLSVDKVIWDFAASGNWAADKTEKEVHFTAATCRYVRLRSPDLEDLNAAEIHLIRGTYLPPPQPMVKLTLQCSSSLGTWTDIPHAEILAPEKSAEFFRIKVEIQ